MHFTVDREASKRFWAGVAQVKCVDFVFHRLENVLKIINETLDEENTEVTEVAEGKDAALHFDEQCRLIEALENPEVISEGKVEDNDGK